MQEHVLTQCPHCGAACKHETAQLRASDGAVRCGDCSQVFDANDNITQTTTIRSNPAIEKSSAEDLISDEEPANSEDATKQPPQPEKPAHTPSEETDQDPYALIDGDDEAGTTTHHDEDWAVNILEELERELPTPTKTQPATTENTTEQAHQAKELTRSFEDLKSQEFDEDPFALTESNETTNANTGNEDWALNMLEELENEACTLTDNQPDQPTQAEASQKQTTGETESDDFFSQVINDFDCIPDLLEEPGTTPQETPDTNSPCLNDSEEPFTQETPETLYFNVQTPRVSAPQHKKRTFKTLLLILLNTLAIITLLAQYIYFHFDELAQEPEYRRWLETFCGVTDCKLPPISDISMIEGTKLIIRPHPQQSNALQVDALIHNRASFSQPYPIIELRFDDANEKVLASRQFLPQDYILDQSIDKNNMPPETPIHFTLEIIIPDKPYAGYQMNFISPLTSSYDAPLNPN